MAATAELRGLVVTMLDGSRLGRVEQVYLDDVTGHPAWATVRIGLLGQRRFVVPLATATRHDGELKVPYGKARVKGSPGTDPGVHIARDAEARLRRYYGVTAEGAEASVPASEAPTQGSEAPVQGELERRAPTSASPGTPGVAPHRPSRSPLPRLENVSAIRANGVLTVALDRPPVNALDVSAYRELHRVFSDVDAIGPDVGAVVLTGTGHYFCAGDDLDELATLTTSEARRERMFHVREAVQAIRECAAPVIAAVGGPALGTGVAMAASCDFVVASADASFQFPKPGVGMAGGARHLSRLLPQPMVRWMYLTGERVTAATMASLGAVVRIASRDVLGEATEIARHIGSMDVAATRAAKRALNGSEALDVQRGFEVEQASALGPVAPAELRSAYRAA